MTGMAFPFEGSSLLDRGPAAGAALEGEWNTWTFRVARLAVPPEAEYCGPIIDNNGVAFANDSVGNNWIHRLDRNGVYFKYLNMSHTSWLYVGGWYRPFRHESVLYRYLLTCDINNPTIFSVIKDYVVVFTRNLLLDVPAQDDIERFAMSPNGRYLAIVSDDTVSGREVLSIYEGS